MTLTSYRRERIGDLKRDIYMKHAAAGRLVVKNVRDIVPVDAGILRASISSDSTENRVHIGTNLEYAPYVHQGTYDYKHGYGGWSEAAAREADTVFFHNALEETGRRGAMPRPFLVNGLLNSREALKTLYG